MFNIDTIKKDFPIFHNNPDLVFLDSAASSQKPQPVIDAVTDFYATYNANVNRGIYQLSEKATNAREEAREKVARFVGATSDEIVFVRNATEAINLVAFNWGRENLKEEDEVLITQMEHHANIVPWQMLMNQQVTSYKLQVTNIKKDYTLDLEDYKKRLGSGKVKLVAVTHVSNVLGTINPVKEIIDLAHDAGATVLIDGAQSVPHMAVNVKDLGADFYAFSGHKMLGPTGIGVLYGKKELLDAMPPFMGGGDMIKEVTFENTIYNDVPHKFEAGTPNIAGAIGLGASVEYLENIGMENVREHEIEITKYALERFVGLDGVKLLGPQDPAIRGSVFAFTIEGAHPHDMASIFDEHNIAIRAGHLCAQPLHTSLGLPGTARASFYIYNSKEEVDALINGIESIKKLFS